MARLDPGDHVFDEQGISRLVLAATEPMVGRPCREVSFSDGSKVVCDDEHLWSALVRRSGVETISVIDARTLAHYIRIGVGVRVPVAAPIVDIEICEQSKLTWTTFSSSQRSRLAAVRREISRDGQLCQGGVFLAGERQELQTLMAMCGLLARIDAGHTFIDLDVKAHLYREVTSVVPVATRPVKCIQVDSPSQLYLCGRTLIPTHNTFLIGEELRRAVRMAVQQNVPVDNEIWYGAPNFVQAKRVMWSRLKAIIPTSWIAGKPNETTCVVNLVSGHKLRLVGLDAHDSLRGVGLWFFAGDEWADTKPEAWSETIRPMLSTMQGHALFVGTPKGHNHFFDLYQKGLEQTDDEHKAFRFTTAQGAQVAPSEIEGARRLLDPRTFRQEYEASFETSSERVLYGFSRESNVLRCDYRPGSQLHIGMDFNINPMTATIWQTGEGRIWQIDEIVLNTSNTDEMAAVMKSRYSLSAPGSVASVDHIFIYPDPAGQQRRSSACGRTDVGILREAGFNIRVLSSHPAVRDRINVMNRVFEAGDGSRAAFVSPNCTKSIEAYSRLRYLDGGSQIDKRSGHDHLVDASGYFIYWWATKPDSRAQPTSYSMGR